MPRVQELNAKGRPRKPEAFQNITDQQWQRLQNTKPSVRWKLVKDEELVTLKPELKTEKLHKTKKVKL